MGSFVRVAFLPLSYPVTSKYFSYRNFFIFIYKRCFYFEYWNKIKSCKNSRKNSLHTFSQIPCLLAVYYVCFIILFFKKYFSELFASKLQAFTPKFFSVDFLIARTFNYLTIM